MAQRIKQQQPDVKLSIGENSCSHVLFNFAFIQSGYGIPSIDASSNLTEAEHKLLLETLIRLSSHPWIEIMARPRKSRPERLDLKIIRGKLKGMQRVDIPSTAIPGTCKLKEDYYSFRLSSEDFPARIIGRMAGTTFFILYIDREGKLYKHS